MIDLVQSARLEQTQTLTPVQLQGLRLLAMPLPALRAEVSQLLATNPAVEDVDHPLEKPLSEVEAERKREENEHRPDYEYEDFTPGARRDDEDEVERRQRIFDNHTGSGETLQQHLLAQLPFSDIPKEDWSLVEVLVGDLNDNGFYAGSMADVVMSFGKSESDIRKVLAEIMDLDPCGCGATNAKECLLAQMDTLEDSPCRETVRRMIENHLEDIAAGRFAEVEQALGLDRAGYDAALKELRSLNPHPGRAFPGEKDRIEYVNPEIHAASIDGRWIAMTDSRSLPEIRFSKAFEAMLSDPKQSAETKAYVRERIENAKNFREAVKKRQETIEAIAQTIFDRQQDFFEKGFAALKPMTELEVAEKVGVSGPTVSKTVRDKYAQTPQGTIELRRFFTTAIRNADGEEISQQAALQKLKELVTAEDAADPLSDEKLAEQLKAAGFPVARRTVAKYRDKLGIPGRSHRRSGNA